MIMMMVMAVMVFVMIVMIMKKLMTMIIVMMMMMMIPRRPTPHQIGKNVNVFCKVGNVLEWGREGAGMVGGGGMEWKVFVLMVVI